MSDNVVLSKHFDSLASAIQRCLSAGYAPTAYIPAGHESVIDNVASTVDGGMWYEVEGHTPIIKMHYCNCAIQVNPTPVIDGYLVVNFFGLASPDKLFMDLAGGSWATAGRLAPIPAWPHFDSAYLNTDYGNAIYEIYFSRSGVTLTRTGDLEFGSTDFTISFWYDNRDNPVYLRFYTADGTEAFTVFSNTDSSDTSVITFGVKYLSNTYTFASVTHPTSVYAHHCEINYNHSAKELSFFNNGNFVSAATAELAETTFNKLVLGLPEGSTDEAYQIGELKIYNGIALHSSSSANFTPTCNPLVSSF